MYGMNSILMKFFLIAHNDHANKRMHSDHKNQSEERVALFASGDAER